MSTSERSSQRQQVYYGQPSQQQASIQQRIGSDGGGRLASSSSTMMVDASPHHRGGGEHQIVVVSGNSNNQCTNCVPSYHSSNCECPSCESKLLGGMGHSPTMVDHQRNELYSYLLPADHGGTGDEEEEDGIVREFLTETGERHVVIMGKNEDRSPQGGPMNVMQERFVGGGSTGGGGQQTLSVQERIRRQKLSEAARNRYALLSEEEKRAVTERRWRMRQRKKQKERELEELEAILRATNDITDDLVPIDEASLQRKRAKISRYQTMSIDERRLYNQKRRLRQLGLPENIEEIPQEKLNQIKKHISEVNSRKAEAARQRYHRMSTDERKIYNRRRTESFRKRRVEEEKLLSTPAGQITPEALEKAQSIMLRNAKRAEQARLRYQKKQQEKGVVPRRQRKPKVEVQAVESLEPNLDQILDTIERDVMRKTEEAKQALKKMQQNEMKKEEPTISAALQQQQFLTPLEGGGGGGSSAATRHLVQSSTAMNVPQQISGQNIVQYVQVPSQGVQNGFIIADKFVQLHTDSGQPGPQYALIQEPPPGTKFEGNHPGTSYYPVSIIQQESPQRATSSGAAGQHHQLGPRIEIVQPTIITTSHGSFEHLTSVPSGGHIIHYNTTSGGGASGQPYTIQIEQPTTSGNSATNRSPAHRRIVVESSPTLMSPIDHKLVMQKAKRAERARRRYHEMSVEARHEFNAKRAQALKMARLRDEELCRLGDEFSLKGEEPDENLRMAIEQARSRRSKRAEAARIKYQKMTNEQRKEHNIARDAQRRQRKRELEDTVTILKQ